MHEFSIASMIMDQVFEEASKRNAKQITEVTLKIGEFELVMEDQLQFCFEVLSENTIAEKANFIIKTAKGKIECKKCGFTNNSPRSNDADLGLLRYAQGFPCEKCKSLDTNLIEGDGIFLEQIKIIA